MEDCLIIGIDISEGKDISCMTVARKSGEEVQVINQLFNEEAEDIYYRLINIHVKNNYPKIKEKAIRKNITRIQNIYSYKEILEAIDYTLKIKDYTDKQIQFILNHNTSKKIQGILATFWLTHTNDEFFNTFGFSWVPPMKIQEEAREQLNIRAREKVMQVPLIEIKNNEINNILEDIQKGMINNISNAHIQKFCNNNLMRGATDE